MSGLQTVPGLLPARGDASKGSFPFPAARIAPAEGGRSPGRLRAGQAGRWRGVSGSTDGFSAALPLGKSISPARAGGAAALAVVARPERCQNGFSLFSFR